MMSSMLQVEQVGYRYEEQGDWLLRGLEIKIEAGDFVWIEGPSGSGKSTFLKLLNRLLEPGEGRIYFHERQVQDYEVTQLRTRIVLVPQESQMIEGTVMENLTFPFRFASLHDRSMPGRDKLASLLKMFELNGLSLDSEAAKLSVGQRMRLSVIRGLLLEPEILLLDEPVAGLDEVSRKAFAEEMVRLNQELNMTLVAISHIPLLKENNGLKRYFLERGRLGAVQNDDGNH